MPQLLRRLGIQVAWISAGTALVVMGAAVYFLLNEARARNETGAAPVPMWWVFVAISVALLVTVAVTAITSLAVSNRTTSLVSSAMERLAQQADEFGSTGFLDEESELESALRPMAFDRSTGVPEVDSIGRILERNQLSLSRALSAERSFAADASHQLRTPLAALLLRLEEIGHTEDLGEAKAEARVAISQTERLASVVDDLLHRTRAGHADGGRSVSLDTVLSVLEQEWHPSFQAQGRMVDVSSERAMIVRASASAMSQVLNTLVENSLQHGGGTVFISARRSGPSALIQVSDEGDGIPVDLARTVFDRAVTTGQGTGLGLSVARERAEAFGGRLELDDPATARFSFYVSMAPSR